MNEKEYFPSADKPQRKPAFDFRNLPPSGNLTYELLSWDNYMQFHLLFKDDSNEFVDRRFKNIGDVRQYTEYQMEYAWYSPKRGGCDWFFLQDNQYAGVIHLYNLSRDKDSSYQCTIGFATAAPFRRQGLTREAVWHLLNQVFYHFDKQEVLSYTRLGNIASMGLLKSLGFENCDEDYQLDEDSRQYHFFRMSRDTFGRMNF